MSKNTPTNSSNIANEPFSSKWITPTIVATLISVASVWSMRSCDKQDANIQKASDQVNENIYQVQNEVKEVSNRLSSLEGQVKIISQVMAVKKGIRTLFYAPSDQLDFLNSTLGSWNFEILEKKPIEKNAVPLSFKSAFPRSQETNWIELTVMKNAAESSQIEKKGNEK